MAVTALEIKTRQPLAGRAGFWVRGALHPTRRDAHFAVDPAIPSIAASPISSSLHAMATAVCIFLRIFASSLPKSITTAHTLFRSRRGGSCLRTIVGRLQNLSGPKGITRCLPTRGFVDARRPGSIWKTMRWRVPPAPRSRCRQTSKGPH